MTGSGTGSFAATIADNSITDAALSAAVGFAKGGTGLTTAADDTLPVSTGAAWEAKAIPNCTDSAGNHLNYTAATNAISCGTSVGTLDAASIATGTIATARGGTNLDTSASTGVPTISAGTWSVAAQLSALRGGTGLDTSASTGVPRIAAGTWSADAGVSHLAASTSAALRGVLSDESGTGAALFAGGDIGAATSTSLTTNASANGATWLNSSWTELITLNLGVATTDSATDLPANSIIQGVTCRITTTIVTSTDWSVGDPTTAARFSSANSTLTAGTTSVGLNHHKGSVTTDAAGPTQTAAAKLRITATGVPTAGAVRCTVFYSQFTAPTS